MASNTFWSDFVAGFAGPAASVSQRRGGRTSLTETTFHGKGLENAQDKAADAYDTLKNLRDTEFWFDEDYKPLVDQLQILYNMGLITTPPELLKDGADIGHGVILTPTALEFLKKKDAH